MKKDILIPKDTSEITIGEFEQFLEIQKLETNELDKLIKTVSLFTNLSISECAKIKPNSLLVLVDKITKALDTTPELPLSHYSIEQHRFYFDYENMTIGEYIDALAMLNLEESKISRFTGIFLRKSYKHTSEVEKRSQIALKVPYSAFIELSKQFVKLNEDIQSNFSNLYADSGGGSDKLKSQRQLLHEKWGWYISLHKLCNGDITKLNSITELNLWEVMTWLSYEADVDSIRAND